MFFKKNLIVNIPPCNIPQLQHQRSSGAGSNFRDHFQFFFFPLSFMEGVLSFNTTTPHSITCLLQLISTLDFVLIRKALAIWDPLLSPLGKADRPPLWAAPVLSPCREGHSCGNSTCSPLLFLDILSLSYIPTSAHSHTGTHMLAQGQVMEHLCPRAVLSLWTDYLLFLPTTLQGRCYNFPRVTEVVI